MTQREKTYHLFKQYTTLLKTGEHLKARRHYELMKLVYNNKQTCKMKRKRYRRASWIFKDDLPF